MKVEQMIEEIKEAHEDITLYNIASVKSYNYCMEYDSCKGIEVERSGSNYLKQGYIDGFIAGFTYKLTGSNDD
jgi:hypothetical protein